MLMVGVGALIALFGLIGTIAVWPEVNKLDNADIGEGLGLDRRYTGPPRGVEQVKRDWAKSGPRTDGGRVEFGSMLVEDV